MKKILTISLILLMASSFVFAQGEGEKAADSVTLVSATINKEGTLLADALKAYGDEIVAQSNGSVAVKFYPGGQLGDAASQYQSVIDGTIDMIYTDTGWFGETYPEFDVLEGNYLFRGKDHFIDVTSDLDNFSYFTDKLVDDPGVVVLMIAGGLERDIISTYPINSIDDVKGKNMRSKSTATNMEWWSLIGANPVPVAFNETYTAVQTGVVNGSQNSPDAMISQRFGEVNNYLARTQHNISFGFIIMNKEKYDSLGAGTQKILTDAAAKIQPIYIEEAFARTDKQVQQLQDEFGLEITNPDRGPFIEASRKQISALAAKYGIEDVMDAIFN